MKLYYHEDYDKLFAVFGEVLFVLVDYGQEHDWRWADTSWPIGKQEMKTNRFEFIGVL